MRYRALALGLLFFGCSSSGDPEGSSGPVALDDFGQQFALAYCDGIAPCCEREFGEFSRQTCLDALRGQLNASLSVATSNPAVVFDERAAGQCLDAYAAVVRSCTDRSLAADLDPACERVLQGTIEEGGACTDSEECANSGHCDSGTCIADDFVEERLGLGERCSETCTGTPEHSSGCIGPGSGFGQCWTGDGLVCGDTGACEAAPAIGQPCTGHCGANAHCESGTCIANTASGPCRSTDHCSEVAYCDFEAQTCTPRKPDGEVCDSDWECQGGQCEDRLCRQWSAASRESCAGLLD